MSSAQQLLSCTHKNAEMGKNTMAKLLPMINDPGLKSVVQLQHDEYTRIFMSAEILLRSGGADVNGVSAVAKTMGNIMIDINTLASKSAPHIAEMLVEGTDRGIKEIDEAFTQYGVSASTEAYNLASALRDALYRNRRELQRYL